MTDFDLLSETSVVELNIDLTYLISSPILPSYHYVFLFSCTLLSDNSVTPTGLANFFSSSSLDNLLASNSPLIDMFFFTKLTRLSTLYYYVTGYNKRSDFKPKYILNLIVLQPRYIVIQVIHSCFISSVSRSERQLDNQGKQDNHHCS